MAATRLQVELIEELQNRGAVIPADDHDNPSSAMFESVEAADEYIRRWNHLISKGTEARIDEWGGIPNS